ncbi:DUF5990 family protein [Streptomyces sp. NRRL S-495]|uniref:DUF5990 family protein n=1 Tax=Streptomyces sp. NRRL S-495 TaxID=1609133 RepID=UPI0005F8EFC3|nr:DUF5990 family protein [Streptomyces sp. NRRL S-495]KJY25980.1 monooxygenase [Streptomyces sp. NRRL S-495]
MQIRIEAVDLPGRSCPGGPDSPDLLHPGDAASAAWTLECAASPLGEGIDLKGPYVQGRPGQRFVYLVWGNVDPDGGFTMFRRAKLMFDGVDGRILAEAVAAGRLVARLGLTDVKGLPLCAAVRPPVVTWSAESAAGEGAGEGEGWA